MYSKKGDIDMESAENLIDDSAININLNIDNNIIEENKENTQSTKNNVNGTKSINNENNYHDLETKNGTTEEINLEPKLEFLCDFIIFNGEKNFTKINDFKEAKVLNVSNQLDTTKLSDADDTIIILDMVAYKNYSHINGNERNMLGYVGIVNEAMTCYMNSMLQTLNILGAFKKAVFKVPTEKETYDSSISLSLQRLFYDLMHETNPITTDKLTKSFGWSYENLHVQHDVQEFNLKLADAMEKQMKGTSVDGFFDNVFQGKVQNYIECINVDYKSTKDENFCDLSLQVKGCNNIYESLDKYTEEEIMEGNDKYEAEGHGKQDARKGIKFVKFPKVLIVQLKRFEYDYGRDQMIKINDKFDYYQDLDLNKYIANNSEKVSEEKEVTKNKEVSKDKENADYNYTLHSVVVHHGNASRGHYYSFLNPSPNEKNWLLFNDEYVRPASTQEVYDLNYGGYNTCYSIKPGGRIIQQFLPCEANAYILVYIKNSARDEMLSNVTLEDVS